MLKSASKSVSFRQLAWKRLKKNRGAMAGLVVIALALLCGIFAYYIAPDATPDANGMILEVSGKKAGFHITLLAVHKEVSPPPTPWWKRLLYGKPSDYGFIPVKNWHFAGDSIYFRHFLDEETSMPEALDLLHMVFPLPPGNPVVSKKGDSIYFKMKGALQKTSIKVLQQQIMANQIIKQTYWLGTDKYGRDILSRIIVGVRVSISVGLVAVLISLAIGIFLGAMAGYFRGRTDDIIMWLINVVWSVPSLLLVFALTIAIGKGFWQIFIAVGLTLWVSVARIIRGQVMGVRELQYIEAAKAMGFSHLRIIFKHILPNILGPVLVIAANNFAAAIIIEAGLSFLGIGVQPPTPSWGLMLKENYGFIITHNPFLAIIPGLAIMIMVLAFNLLGNGLRDAMDVKGKL